MDEVEGSVPSYPSLAHVIVSSRQQRARAQYWLYWARMSALSLAVEPVSIAESSCLIRTEVHIPDYEGFHIVVIVLTGDVADIGTVGAEVAAVRPVVALPPVILATVGIYVADCPIARVASVKVLSE